MDIRQQSLNCSKMYSYIGVYITPPCCDQKAMLVYISAKQLPDDGLVIKQGSILLPFVPEPHHNLVGREKVISPRVIDRKVYNLR